jgi:hypothetical protein
MTSTEIRIKVHKYIDEADSKVLDFVYQLLEVYRQNNSSQINDEQQTAKASLRLKDMQ